MMCCYLLPRVSRLLGAAAQVVSCHSSAYSPSLFTKQRHMWPERGSFCQSRPSAVFTYKLNRKDSVRDFCVSTHGASKYSCLMSEEGVSSAVQLWFTLTSSVTFTLSVCLPPFPWLLFFSQSEPFNHLFTYLVRQLDLHDHTRSWDHAGIHVSRLQILHLYLFLSNSIHEELLAATEVV